MSSTDLFIQQIANGLVIGISYALIAIGLTLVFGILDILNFSHGEFYMLGGTVTYVMVDIMNFNYFVSILLVVVVVTIMGMLIQKVAIQPIIEHDQLSVLLVTFAVSLFLINITQIVWGKTPQKVQSPINDTFELGPVVFTYQKLFIILIGFVLLVLLNFYIKKTTTGKMMRAVAQDKIGATVIGVNVKNIYMITFGLAAALAAFAGAIISPTTFVDAYVGQDSILKAFAIVVLGGLGSVPGALLGGILLGIVETITAAFVDSAFKDLTAFLILIMVLLLKPSGLFGRKGV